MVSGVDGYNGLLEGALTHSDGCARYTLQGELDIANADRLASRLVALIEEHDGDLELDLADVSFIDSIQDPHHRRARIAAGGRGADLPDPAPVATGGPHHPASPASRTSCPSAAACAGRTSTLVPPAPDNINCNRQHQADELGLVGVHRPAVDGLASQQGEALRESRELLGTPPSMLGTSPASSWCSK